MMNQPVLDFRVRPPLASFVEQMIFTGHTHEQLERERQNLPVIYRDREESESARQNSMEVFFEEFESAGLTHGVVMGRNAGPRGGIADNAEIATFCATHPTFDGMAGIDGRDTAAALTEVKRARDSGLLGAVFDNGMVGLHQDDSRLWPIYEAVAEEGLILALTASQLMGADSTWSHPDRIRPIARAFPDTPIVIPHAAWAWTTHACALAYECSNIYLLPDCYLNTGAPGTSEYVTAANTFMPDRLLYGSAYPLRPLGTSLASFTKLPLTPTALTSALWNNGLDLLHTARR